MRQPRTPHADRPGYDVYQDMESTRGVLADKFAEQILRTTAPFLTVPTQELTILDIGCANGNTTIELARRCARVVGLEPVKPLYDCAERRRAASGLANVSFRNEGIYELEEVEQYDLVVLDNVFEHLPDQPLALELMSRSLKKGGALFLLMPNKVWPVEVHYHLPFLSYLPLRWANLYLRLTGRGSDYTDASYAPTYFGLKRLLKARRELKSHFVLPADLSLTMAGASRLYRWGAAAIRRFPWLWAISKAFLVVAVKS
jgi:SAM-dependent methyltransferase